MIRSVGVETLFDSPCGQTQNLPPRSGFDCFKIYAFGNAGAQQCIQFSGDVASQLCVERRFFLNRPPFLRSRSGPRRSVRSLSPVHW